MGILDELVEKKNLRIYIDCRIQVLKSEMIKEMEKQPEKKREVIRQRFKGRIAELEKLNTALESGKLKQMAKRYYQRAQKLGSDE